MVKKSPFSLYTSHDDKKIFPACLLEREVLALFVVLCSKPLVYTYVYRDRFQDLVRFSIFFVVYDENHLV